RAFVPVIRQRSISSSKKAECRVPLVLSGVADGSLSATESKDRWPRELSTSMIAKSDRSFDFAVDKERRRLRSGRADVIEGVKKTIPRRRLLRLRSRYAVAMRLFAVTVLLLGAAEASATPVTPMRSFNRLISSNGFAVVSYDRMTQKIDTFW